MCTRRTASPTRTAMRSGAFRGFGVPQVTFASEQQVDEIAAKLGLDPIAMPQEPEG